MRNISHKRFSSKVSEGVTVYSADLGRGPLLPRQFVTLFYGTGHIATGKTSRDGKTVYISLKNFPFHGLNLPQCGKGNDKTFSVSKVSVLKTRSSK